jgi:protein-S-isoprenylcysteine O-methyltransferase Ste14
LLIAAGVALYLMCAFWGFALRGKGTPLPLDPPKKLVIEGPYQVVRNPMYWGVGSVVLGEAAIFHSLALAELACLFAERSTFPQRASQSRAPVIECRW